MKHEATTPAELKVFLNHIYELKKGVRSMALYTTRKCFGEAAVRRLESQGIRYAIQPVSSGRINIYFGRPECIEAIGLLVRRPLNQLTPEEDFMLGALLGYDICGQCRRYCERKTRSEA